MGNWASAANWSTRERMLSTEEEMTSLDLRMTATDGDSMWASVRVVSRRAMWRWICSAEREMGVSGFLISWATRLATALPC